MPVPEKPLVVDNKLLPHREPNIPETISLPPSMPSMPESILSPGIPVISENILSPGIPNIPGNIPPPQGIPNMPENTYLEAEDSTDSLPVQFSYLSSTIPLPPSKTKCSD